MEAMIVLLIAAGMIAVYIVVRQISTIRATLHAEAHLKGRIAELARKENKYRKLIAQMHGEAAKASIGDMKTRIEIIKLIEKAMIELDKNEKKLLREGLQQPSAIGRNDYALKLISQTENITANHC